MDAVELVSVTTEDGVALHGALCHVENSSDANQAALAADSRSSDAFPIDVAISMHGVGGSFYSGKLFPPLVAGLRHRGCPVLLANNRGHDGFYTASRNGKACRIGAAYECVDDCRLDLRAWLSFLESRGLKRIGLIGHSLGAIKVVYAQAIECFESVTALVSLSAPSLSFDRFKKSAKRTDFEADLVDAKTLLDAGNEGQLFETRVPFPMLLAASAYLDKYGPDERYEVIRHAAKLTCPSLFMYGESELNAPTDAFRDVPNHLRNLSNAKQWFDVEVVPGGDHFYTGRQDWLAGRIVSWLSSRSFS